MFTLKRFYEHLMLCMLIDAREINYSERIVACEMLAQTFGWQHETDIDFFYTYMEKSGLFTKPVEKRMLAFPVEVSPGRGRILGTLPAGMGL